MQPAVQLQGKPAPSSKPDLLWHCSRLQADASLSQAFPQPNSRVPAWRDVTAQPTIPFGFCSWPIHGTFHKQVHFLFQLINCSSLPDTPHNDNRAARAACAGAGATAGALPCSLFGLTPLCDTRGGPGPALAADQQ